MKIKHIWSVLCRESIINQDDNVLSIIGVLEDLNLTFTVTDPKIPKPEKITIPFNFEIVNYWTKDIPEEIKIQIRTSVVDPEGKELSGIVNEPLFPLELKNLRSRLKVQGLSVTKNGKYHFKISMKTDKEKEFKVVAELPLNIKIQIVEPQKTQNN